MCQCYIVASHFLIGSKIQTIDFDLIELDYCATAQKTSVTLNHLTRVMVFEKMTI